MGGGEFRGPIPLTTEPATGPVVVLAGAGILCKWVSGYPKECARRSYTGAGKAGAPLVGGTLVGETEL